MNARPISSVHWSIGGMVAKVPICMRDRRRTFRRLRPVLGRHPVCLQTGRGFSVYAAKDSVAAAVHVRRLARSVSE